MNAALSLVSPLRYPMKMFPVKDGQPRTMHRGDVPVTHRKKATITYSADLRRNPVSVAPPQKATKRRLTSLGFSPAVRHARSAQSESPIPDGRLYR